MVGKSGVDAAIDRRGKLRSGKGRHCVAYSATSFAFSVAVTCDWLIDEAWSGARRVEIFIDHSTLFHEQPAS